MGQVAGVDQPERNVLGEDCYVLVVGAEAVAFVVVGPVSPHDGFLGTVTVVVCF